MTTTTSTTIHTIPDETIADLKRWADTAPQERREHRLRLLQAVDRARAGDSQVVHDRGFPEASDTIYVIARVSSKRFYSLCHELHDDAYSTPDVVMACADFLERGGQMRIVVEQRKSWDALQRSPFVRAMLDTRAENFSLMIAGAERKEAPHNFIVGDHFACRWEEDRKAIIGNSDFGNHGRAAETGKMFDAEWARFGDEKFARQTKDRFRRVWKDAVDPDGRSRPDNVLHLQFQQTNFGLKVTSPELPNLCLDIDRLSGRTRATIENAASHLVSYKVGTAVRYRLSEDNRTLVR